MRPSAGDCDSSVWDEFCVAEGGGRAFRRERLSVGTLGTSSMVPWIAVGATGTSSVVPISEGGRIFNHGGLSGGATGTPSVVPVIAIGATGTSSVVPTLGENDVDERSVRLFRGSFGGGGGRGGSTIAATRSRRAIGAISNNQPDRRISNHAARPRGSRGRRCRSRIRRRRTKTGYRSDSNPNRTPTARWGR